MRRLESGKAENATETRWLPFQTRFRNGEWRAPIFRDMILSDAQTMGRGLTFVDIGCGRGFDDDKTLQRSLAERCERYIGIEPDEAIALEPHFTETYRCVFEEAPIAPGSVDIAFAVMVLEHLVDPGCFFNSVFRVLKPGGLFWGFTPDFRHFGCWMSQGLEVLHLKDLYLRCAIGRRGVVCYENYRTFYRANSPARIAAATSAFGARSFIGFKRVGQLDYYTPKYLRPFTHLLDRLLIRFKYPGPFFAVRLQK